MGNSCTHPDKKRKAQLRLVSQQALSPTHKENPAFNAQAARVGPFFLKPLASKRVLELQARWNKMLANFAEAKQPFDACFSNPSCRGKFLQLVKKGPPVQFRWEAWKAMTRLGLKVNEAAYMDLPFGSFSTMCAIYKDLDRTFPDQPFFDQTQWGSIGQSALTRLLGRLAGKYVKLGYCQSMNFVGGFLLLLSGGNDLEAFYMMETLLEAYQLKHFYTEEMLYLKRSMWVFQRLFEQQLPRLAAHFGAEDVVPELWVTKWFLTLFVNILSPAVVVRIWDCFLVDRIAILYQASLAIVGKFEKELLALDTAGICMFLANISGHFTNAEAFISEAGKYAITYNDIKILERRHSFEVSSNTPTHSPPLTTCASLEPKPTVEILSDYFSGTPYSRRPRCQTYDHRPPPVQRLRKPETESEFEQMDPRELLSDLEFRDNDLLAKLSG